MRFPEYSLCTGLCVCNTTISLAVEWMAQWFICKQWFEVREPFQCRKFNLTPNLLHTADCTLMLLSCPGQESGLACKPSVVEISSKLDLQVHRAFHQGAGNSNSRLLAFTAGNLTHWATSPAQPNSSLGERIVSSYHPAPYSPEPSEF